jgi:hypothetical protein
MIVSECTIRFWILIIFSYSNWLTPLPESRSSLLKSGKWFARLLFKRVLCQSVKGVGN